MSKLVSVITPTYNRPKLLKKCHEMLLEQTYDNLEHVIVYDGPSDDFLYDDKGKVRISTLELSRNWSSLLHNSFGIAPLVVGMLIARGDYQIWLSDDDEMTPEHIEKLVNLIETKNVDFVYSKCRFYWNGESKEEGYDIGTFPPELGQITNFLYKTELLYREGCMPMFDTHPVDWNL